MTEQEVEDFGLSWARACCPDTPASAECVQLAVFLLLAAYF